MLSCLLVKFPINQATQKSCSRCEKWRSQKKMAYFFPKECWSDREKVGPTLDFWFQDHCLFPWHHVLWHTQPSHRRDWRVFCLLGSGDPSCSLPLCYATICDPTEALSVTVFENCDLLLSSFSYHSSEPGCVLQQFHLFLSKDSWNTSLFSLLFCFCEVFLTVISQSALSDDHSKKA